MKRLILLSAAALAALAATYQWSPDLRLRALVALGRNHQCPLERALEAPHHQREITAAKDRLLAATRELRTEGRLKLYATPQGEYWIPYREKTSLYAFAWNMAEMDTRFYGSGARTVKKGDIVLDCGANVGVFTRLALNDGAAKVIAIEPMPDNIHALEQTFASEIAAGRVIVYGKGVWDKDDFLPMLIDPTNSAADSFVIEQKGAQASAVKLPLTTIDQLVAELKLERVDFIKMDIEGAEVKALTGGRATISRFRPRMALSTYHTPTDPHQIPLAVSQAKTGYRIECGPCQEIPWGVRPDVMYFY